MHDLDVQMADTDIYTGIANNDNHRDDIRSPRTPTFTIFPSLVAPFDHTKFFQPSKSSTSPMKRTTSIPPPPPSTPLAWVWQCHLCKQRYPLAATRRCLLDGHYYCSGETNRPNLKKKKRGQACSSEFDYVGWKEYGKWRHKIVQLNRVNANATSNSNTTTNTSTSAETNTTPSALEGCENCTYPSQCRYTTSPVLTIQTITSSSGSSGSSSSMKSSAAKKVATTTKTTTNLSAEISIPNKITSGVRFYKDEKSAEEISQAKKAAFAAVSGEKVDEQQKMLRIEEFFRALEKEVRSSSSASSSSKSAGAVAGAVAGAGAGATGRSGENRKRKVAIGKSKKRSGGNSGGGGDGTTVGDLDTISEEQPMVTEGTVATTSIVQLVMPVWDSSGRKI